MPVQVVHNYSTHPPIRWLLSLCLKTSSNGVSTTFQYRLFRAVRKFFWMFFWRHGWASTDSAILGEKNPRPWRALICSRSDFTIPLILAKATSQTHNCLKSSDYNLACRMRDTWGFLYRQLKQQVVAVIINTSPQDCTAHAHLYSPGAEKIDVCLQICRGRNLTFKSNYPLSPPWWWEHVSQEKDLFDKSILFLRSWKTLECNFCSLFFNPCFFY